MHAVHRRQLRPPRRARRFALARKAERRVHHLRERPLDRRGLGDRRRRRSPSTASTHRAPLPTVSRSDCEAARRESGARSPTRSSRLRTRTRCPPSVRTICSASAVRTEARRSTRSSSRRRKFTPDASKWNRALSAHRAKVSSSPSSERSSRATCSAKGRTTSLRRGCSPSRRERPRDGDRAPRHRHRVRKRSVGAGDAAWHQQSRHPEARHVDPVSRAREAGEPPCASSTCRAPYARERGSQPLPRVRGGDQFPVTA